MKIPSINSINVLLQNSPIINDIRHKLQQLQQLNNIISNLLPPEEAKNCSVANLRDGILILTTSSPIWNHKINFLKMDLLESLRKNYPEWAGITSIVVKIDYLITEIPSSLQNINNVCCAASRNNGDKRFYISLNTAELINNIANQEIAYQPLSDALKKLTNKQI